MPKSRISTLTGAAKSLRNAKFLSSPSARLFNCAGVVAVIGLAALPAFLTLAPMFSSMEANAEPQAIGAAATIVPNLSLSAENVSMVMTPTGSGSIFKTGSIDATVSNNNETGYTLYFSDKDDNTSLSHANLANTAITSTASSLTGTNMLANTWGYTLSSPAAEGVDEVNNTTNLGLTYNSIPTDYAAIKTRSTQTTPSETSKLTFGVKIDNSIPSGTYSDEILISAVINYSSAGYDQNQLWLNKNGTRITTLQEMTPDVCASVPTPVAFKSDGRINADVPEITLRDVRDNETYIVRKLADGNCWMSENLRLTKEGIERAGNSATLSSATSDVAPSNTFTMPADDSWSYNSNNPMPALLYDESRDGKNGKNYGAHYNALTATARTQIYTMTELYKTIYMPYSICPSGWRLPDAANADNKGFHGLFDTYNITSNTEASVLAAVAPPLSFTLGGVVFGALGGAETSGAYMVNTFKSTTLESSIVVTVANMYLYTSNDPNNTTYNRGWYTVFNATNHNGAQADGRSVRCVAR